MIRRCYLAVLIVAVFAGCQQLLGLDPGEGAGAGGAAPAGSSTASSSTGGASVASSTSGGGTSTSATGSSNGGASVTSAASGSGTSTSASTTGSSSGGMGGSTSSVCDNNIEVLPASQGFVDDFETPTRFLGWYSFADVPNPDAGTPSMFFSTIARDGPGAGAAGTFWAGNTSGAGIVSPTAGGFGAGFGFNMKNASGQCAGVMVFDGVSFWAKGSAGAGNALTFQAVVPATQSKASGGDCVSDCFNHPSTTVTLSASWMHYSIKWTDLAPGTDATGPVKVNGIILGLSWITPGPNLDVWIDEVALYAGTSPTGPVGNCTVDNCDAGDGG